MQRRIAVHRLKNSISLVPAALPELAMALSTAGFCSTWNKVDVRCEAVTARYKKMMCVVNVEIGNDVPRGTLWIRPASATKKLALRF
jgi:hypothetical protein